MRYVIIGNSAAAIGCIEGIRQVDKLSEIVVISKEKYHTYSRPLISYYLLGKTDLDRMKYRGEAFYKENGCECIFGKAVTKIEAEKRAVVLDDGSSLSYDKLMIATGSKPLVPKLDGIDTVPKRFGFMSLDDALELEKNLSRDSRVLIVGAGLIGMKCAEGIVDRVKQVTVLDLSDRVLSSILDAEGAMRVSSYLERTKGISFILGTTVRSFDKTRAKLADGRELEFDILVLAVGVRPNIDLARAASIDCGKGIITDENMQTSIEDIYAAGDCCESFDIASSEQRVLALLPNAYRQGESAGVAMAGGKKPFDRAVPFNSIGFFDMHIVTAGVYQGEVYSELGKDKYKKLFYSDNKLKGYIIIGDISKAGIYTSLIQNAVPLSSIDFELICESPSLMAFSKKYRSEKLGGLSV